MDSQLRVALDNPIWKEHRLGKTYTMDGESGWKIAYYPILECGKTGEQYDKPRVLIEKPRRFKGVMGIDFREVPILFLTADESV